MLIQYTSIGIIKSPFRKKTGMPIQTTGAIGVKGEIEIYPDFEGGLKDLDGFSHIILIYHLHESTGFQLELKPFMDDKLHGVFSTRAPKRPNSIGFSVVRLIKIENNILHIENIDILNGTPLLDIKPYIPDIDCHEVNKIGWLEGKSGKMKDKRSDSSF